MASHTTISGRFQSSLPLLLAIAASLLPYVATRAQERMVPPPDAAGGYDLTRMISLLPYIFFDKGSGTIPARYRLFASRAETDRFSDTLPSATAPVMYLDVLNIIGCRMRRHPGTSITITGCNSNQADSGETIQVSSARGLAVRDYLRDIWGIDTARLRLDSSRGLPPEYSNPRVPEGNEENRRVEISSGDWEITRPFISRGNDTAGGPPGERLHYLLIRFKFDNPAMGALNERMLAEMIVPMVTPETTIRIRPSTDQYDDLVYDHSFRLARERGKFTLKELQKTIPIAGFTGMELDTESPEPLFGVLLPEDRFYSRSVLIKLIRPKR